MKSLDVATPFSAGLPINQASNMKVEWENTAHRQRLKSIALHDVIEWTTQTTNIAAISLRILLFSV